MKCRLCLEILNQPEHVECPCVCFPSGYILTFAFKRYSEFPVAAQPRLLIYLFHLPTLQDGGLFHELLIVLQTSSCPFVCHPQKNENRTNDTGVPPMVESDLWL